MPQYGSTPVDYDPFGMGEQYRSISAQPGQPYGVARRTNPMIDLDRSQYQVSDMPAMQPEDVENMRTRGESYAASQAARERDERAAADAFIRQAQNNPAFQSPGAKAALRYFTTLHNYANSNADMIAQMRGRARPQEDVRDGYARMKGADPGSTVREGEAMRMPTSIRPPRRVPTTVQPPPQREPTNMPRLQRGLVMDGYTYLGGDPNDQTNWAQVNGR